MDRSFILLLIIRSSFSSDIEENTALTAVSNSPYTRLLYKQIQTEEAPPSTNLSVAEPLIRDRICSHITGAGFFSWWNLARIDKAEVMRKRDHYRYKDLFHRIYRTETSVSNSYEYTEYTNPYKPRKFVLMPHMTSFKEYVIVCPMKRSFDRLVIPFYVSKEYNVSSSDGLYKPGRFVFGSYYPSPLDQRSPLILAEEPARAYTDPNFNIELYYLQIRKHFKPVEKNEKDPLCGLIRGATNQHYRLCAAISSSSYFKDEIFYARETFNLCLPRKISFQTSAAAEKARGKSYFERMTLCLSAYKEPKRERIFLYISRAYASNQVLVYRLDTSSKKIYLENLSTNIDIVDEVNSFNFVED